MEYYLAAVVQGLCLSGLVLGIYLSMKIFNIPDITTDGSYTLGAALGAVLSTQQLPFVLILPAVVAAGALAGSVTGLIHTRLKVHPLLAGILVMSSLYSVNLLVMGRSFITLTSVPGSVNGWITIGYAAILLGMITYLLRSDFGIAMRATGNGETMVKAFGVNTSRMKVIGLAIANALTATSGFMIARMQAFADINMGMGIVITGLAAVVIGESLILVFRLRKLPLVLVTMFSGVVLFELALAFALSAGLDPVLLKLVTSTVVLLLVAATKLSIKRIA